MKIKSSYLVLKTDNPVKESSSRLRGYIGHRFQEYSLLHHHIQGSGHIYTYPLIQYKIINNQPCILGIEEGASVVKEISDMIDNLILGNSVYNVDERILYQKETDMKICDKTHYNILSPWIALNSKNYDKYNKLRNWKDKKLFLNNILIGNILSMCKGLGIIINRKIYLQSLLEEEKIVFKGIHMVGFTGEFTVNFQIPDFFGLGKGVSQGFGTIKSMNIENE